MLVLQAAPISRLHLTRGDLRGSAYTAGALQARDGELSRHHLRIRAAQSSTDAAGMPHCSLGSRLATPHCSDHLSHYRSCCCPCLSGKWFCRAHQVGLLVVVDKVAVGHDGQALRVAVPAALRGHHLQVCTCTQKEPTACKEHESPPQAVAHASAGVAEVCAPCNDTRVHQEQHSQPALHERAPVHSSGTSLCLVAVC